MFRIDPQLKAVANDLLVGVIRTQVKIGQSDEILLKRMSDLINHVSTTLALADIANLPAVEAARKVYRALGKDPTRYRLSSEALMRRSVKGHALYQINNVIDLNNVISLESNHSIGMFDASKIEGHVTFRVGEKDEPYEGIGRGPLNIEGLPVLSDAKGAFGSPTSDSLRTCVTDQTKDLMVCIIAFDGSLDKTLDLMVEGLKKHAFATDIQIIRVV